MFDLQDKAPKAASTTAAQTAISDTAGQILGPDPKRKLLRIENTGTSVLRLNLGTDTPTQTVYHASLKACAGANDGSGGVFTIDDWVGPVQGISSVAGGTAVILVTRVGNPDWNQAMALGSTL